MVRTLDRVTVPLIPPRAATTSLTCPPAVRWLTAGTTRLLHSARSARAPGTIPLKVVRQLDAAGSPPPVPALIHVHLPDQSSAPLSVFVLLPRRLVWHVPQARPPAGMAAVVTPSPNAHAHLTGLHAAPVVPDASPTSPGATLRAPTQRFAAGTTSVLTTTPLARAPILPPTDACPKEKAFVLSTRISAKESARRLPLSSVGMEPVLETPSRVHVNRIFPGGVRQTRCATAPASTVLA